MTTLTTDRPVSGGSHPYGVHVGDRVWLFPGGGPLSSEYVKPDCKPALVVAFRSETPPQATYQVWAADLVYVDGSGSFRFVAGVRQIESSASIYGGQRSYGSGQSWHRDVVHDGE